VLNGPVMYGEPQVYMRRPTEKPQPSQDAGRSDASSSGGVASSGT